MFDLQLSFLLSLHKLESDMTSSHDPQTISVVSHVHDPQGGPQLVLKDGDIMNNVIEDIVAQATSSSSSSEDEAEDTTG